MLIRLSLFNRRAGLRLTISTAYLQPQGAGLWLSGRSRLRLPWMTPKKQEINFLGAEETPKNQQIQILGARKTPKKQEINFLGARKTPKKQEINFLGARKTPKKQEINFLGAQGDA